MSVVLSVRVQIKQRVNILTGAFLLLMGCISSPVHAEPTAVVASIKPLQLIIALLNEPLAVYGNSMKVSTLLPQGATPHDYALKPSDIMKVLQADLVIWMGPLIEPYLTPIIARVEKHKVVDISQLSSLHRLSLRPLLSSPLLSNPLLSSHHHHESAMGALSFDPHLWWSVTNAGVIARAVMQKVVSDSEVRLSTEKLDEQLALLAQLLMKYKAQATAAKPSFILFHDGLHYVEQDLGVESVARVALDDDHQPGIKTLLALKKTVIQHKVLCVVAEPNTSLSIVGKIEGEVPMRRVIIDSLGWNARSYGDMLQHAYQQILSCRE